MKPWNRFYPETDGEPIAEDSRQFHWLTKIEGGLQHIFYERPDVLVAADLFWYPVEGNPYLRTAPDVMVALGRPKGDRWYYLQWEEGGHPPDVVFEILAVGRRKLVMLEKLRFYERFGVEEYYIYDPHKNEGSALIREDGKLRERPQLHGWTSPKLGIRFDLSGPELVIIRPDGEPLRSRLELQAEIDRDKVEIARMERQIEIARMKTEIVRMQAETARMEAEFARREVEIASMEAEIASMEAEIASMKTEIATMQAENAKIQAEKKKEAEIEEIQRETAGSLRDIDRMKASLLASDVELPEIEG